MRCENPYSGRDGTFPCGKCPPCRINSKRQWTGRLVAEWLGAPRSVFVTLTYDDKNAPADGSVDPRTLQRFLKRLRFEVHPHTFRFFAVGEYGETTFRPHYHAIFYGLGLEHGPAIQKAWGLGFTHLGEVNLNSLNYCTGYTLKKMTKGDDPRLEGRHPEFSRYSLKPGLGVGFCQSLAQGLMTREGTAALSALGDVPHQTRMAGKTLPISQYRRRWLRQALGWEPQQPAEARQKLHEMHAHQAAIDYDLGLKGRSIQKAHSQRARAGLRSASNKRSI